MRALRVIGLAEDGDVVLETVPQQSGERPERFTLPADERLHAAARGDLVRLGQIEIQLESQMRPREIQTRIRAGESVEQVAEAGGLPIQRVERYAYPVLLERSRTADLAQQAHPVRDDGPDVRTLTEVVAGTFGMRGHDYATAEWDSWRGEDNRWVAQLRWRTGRSENAAHWTFHPGAHGGTVTTLDDNAVELISPSVSKPLRTVPPVAAPARPDDRSTPEGRETEAPAPTTPPAAEPSLAQPPAETPAGPTPPTARPGTPAASSPVARPAVPAAPDPPAEPAPEPTQEPAASQAPPSRAPASQAPASQAPASQAPPSRAPGSTDSAGEGTARGAAQPELEADPAREPESEPVTEQAATGTEPAPRRGRRGRPVVPSWEDVLLGTRSSRD